MFTEDHIVKTKKSFYFQCKEQNAWVDESLFPHNYNPNLTLVSYFFYFQLKINFILNETVEIADK